VALTGEEYLQALEESAGRGIAGGAIYDALLAQCALKVEASTIYTWNVRHYSLCGDEVVKRLRTPLTLLAPATPRVGRGSH
jgi:predicted nucleic acid-binding protein